jgi:hypothetical protein
LLCRVKPDDALEVFAAVLKVKWEDGAVEESTEFPVGEVQHPSTRDRVGKESMALMAPLSREIENPRD